MALVLDEDLVHFEKNISDMFILHKTILLRKYKIVKALLAKGYDVNRSCPPNGITPLMATCFLYDTRDTSRFAALLMKHHANPSLADKKGRNILHYAAANRHSELIRAVLEGIDFNLNAQDQYGNTALHTAAMAGDSSTLCVLLQAFQCFAVPLSTPNLLKLTPLVVALLNEHIECAAALREAGGSPVLNDEQFERIVQGLRQDKSLSAKERKLVSRLSCRTLTEVTKGMCIGKDHCTAISSPNAKGVFLPKVSQSEPNVSVFPAISSLHTAANGRSDIVGAISRLRHSCPSLSYSLRCLQTCPSSAKDKKAADEEEVVAFSVDQGHGYEPMCCLYRLHLCQFTPSYRMSSRCSAPVDQSWLTTVWSYTHPHPDTPPPSATSHSAKTREVKRMLRNQNSASHIRVKAIPSGRSSCFTPMSTD